ncbi:unnamed protein product, partial [Meganyctiphanes norvegica]
IVCTVVYYGLSLNSGNLGGNLFVTFTMTMLIEIPSYIFAYLALTRLGRKGTLSFVLLLGGAACFVSGFISEGKPCGRTALFASPTLVTTHTFTDAHLKYQIS